MSQNLGTLGIWKYKETCYHPEHAGMDSALRHGAFRLVGLQPDCQSCQVVNLRGFQPKFHGKFLTRQQETNTL